MNTADLLPDTKLHARIDGADDDAVPLIVLVGGRGSPVALCGTGEGCQ
ncbi:hypothetical protein Q9299_09600 [Gemmobacter fulvus]|nr:hypothetical protein [Gemmobacter fulvus]MDQ1848539.1 hypothetical protein [Gemmobacter fulvus]